MFRPGRRVGAAAVLVLALTTPMGVAALEQSGAGRVISNQIDAVNGNQGIRTDPATVVGVGYIHPVQIDTGASGGNFVAIGTANGIGAGAGTNCANDYDPKWTVYADGETGGVYWCSDFTQDAYTTGSNPTFSIIYRFCPAVSGNRWTLIFDGSIRTCVFTGETAGSAATVGIETTGASTTDRNIDVKYTNLLISRPGTTALENMAPNAIAGPAPNYTVTIVSGTAVNAYLAPLN